MGAHSPQKTHTHSCLFSGDLEAEKKKTTMKKKRATTAVAAALFGDIGFLCSLEQEFQIRLMAPMKELFAQDEALEC